MVSIFITVTYLNLPPRSHPISMTNLGCIRSEIMISLMLGWYSISPYPKKIGIDLPPAEDIILEINIFKSIPVGIELDLEFSEAVIGVLISLISFQFPLQVKYSSSECGLIAQGS
jgi:hypothetical protein